MRGRTVQAQAKNSKGDELTFQSHDSDSPILPVGQLLQLQNFRPDLVDFVVAQTEAEALHRRANDKRIGIFIFIERVLGQVVGLLLAALGIGGGIYAGVNEMEGLSIAIVSFTIGSLGVAAVTRQLVQNKVIHPTKKPPI